MIDLADYEKRLDVAIGERVRLRREALGVSQARLGAAIGVTFQQVQKYEHGRNRISASKLTLIAEALSCDAADLIEAERAAVPGVGALVRAWGRLTPPQRAAVTAMLETFDA